VIASSARLLILAAAVSAVAMLAFLVASAVV